MIDNRQKAAMLIAVINKISKTLDYQVAVGHVVDLEALFEDRLNFSKLADELIEYLDQEPADKLARQLMLFNETRNIRKYSETLPSGTIKSDIVNLADSIDKLYDYGSRITDKSNCDYPHLLPVFHSETAKELFDRAVNANYLDYNYKPNPDTDHYQLKLIAYAIISILQMPSRNAWVHFDHQWGITSSKITSFRIPRTKGNEIIKIVQLYPEVDFRPLLSSKNDEKKSFICKLSEAQARALFKALVDNGYIASNTKAEDFLTMAGLVNMPPHMIKWTSTMYELVYFVARVFSDTNSDVWYLTTLWFNMDGRDELNRETLKSKRSYIFRNMDKFDSMCKDLDQIVDSTLR
ncbi:MAG: hypothetical protein SO287_08910 [Parabacteroides sp.]|nr:hypothetical protein [Bacteroides sp.]MDY4757689.1 hypothetical protein [Parabacteroides sp.]